MSKIAAFTISLTRCRQLAGVKRTPRQKSFTGPVRSVSRRSALKTRLADLAPLKLKEGTTSSTARKPRRSPAHSPSIQLPFAVGRGRFGLELRPGALKEECD